MLNFQRACWLCLAIVWVASPASAVDRVPGPPKISITPPKPPSVIRVNPPSVRPPKSPLQTIPTPSRTPSMTTGTPPKSPSMTTTTPLKSPSQIITGPTSGVVGETRDGAPLQTTVAPAKSPLQATIKSEVGRGETRDGPAVEAPQPIATPAKSPSPPTTEPTSEVVRDRKSTRLNSS